jgi:hypothetical protein
VQLQFLMTSLNLNPLISFTCTLHRGGKQFQQGRKAGEESRGGGWAGRGAADGEENSPAGSREPAGEQAREQFLSPSGRETAAQRALKA